MRFRRDRINRTVIKLGNDIFKHLGTPTCDRWLNKRHMPWSEFVECVDAYFSKSGISRDTPIFSIDIQNLEVGARVSVYIGSHTNELFITDMSD